MNEKEIEEAVNNTIKAAEKPVEVRISVGAEIFNIFSKCGGNMKPASFKEFERQATKYFYSLAGADVGDALCNFDCFIVSYIQMLEILGAVQSENKLLKEKLGIKDDEDGRREETSDDNRG